MNELKEKIWLGRFENTEHLLNAMFVPIGSPLKSMGTIVSRATER